MLAGRYSGVKYATSTLCVRNRATSKPFALTALRSRKLLRLLPIALLPRIPTRASLGFCVGLTYRETHERIGVQLDARDVIRIRDRGDEPAAFLFWRGDDVREDVCELCGPLAVDERCPELAVLDGLSARTARGDFNTLADLEAAYRTEMGALLSEVPIVDGIAV